MKKYNSLISDFDQENLDMIAKELPEFTNENLDNIKNKFKEKTMNKKNNLKKIILRSLATAACVCVSFVGLVNTNTTFAAQLLDIPVIGTITNFVTIDKLELYDKYREINIEIPVLEGLENTKTQEEINNILKERGIAVYDKALENAEKIKDESEKAGFLTSMPELVSQNYTLIRNDNEVLSFKVVTTEIKASGYERANFYNVDLKNCKLLNINDLFKENYDYISVINNEIISKMKEAIQKEDEAYFIEEFRTIDENTNFYIREEGKLVIVFNEYEIAAGYMGMPEFIIETSIFSNNISDLGYLK
ncbi:MAG: DUF3298 and DUF4163 domain-containing protein [Anaeromicrobium sp.]|jgi:hypothetical protein|uniref:DUF3298 and DUF4163 domain-containing protein n=1 Tax=Anaeromicrobium sp. TaxID=1929132 RepID=UPI0025D61A06|nr:DUF3298 and DUF4163 domain-containing protein [Anaeromicrobium sp.]MCT4595467.1 DUF3298 and DUF4163 domain-containing protein [Anaeromicrobium sp.]